MISIISVNWHSYDFLGLLIESIERFTSINWDFIVVDNSIHKQRIERYHVHQFVMDTNIGHGAGLNFGVQKAIRLFPFNKYVMFLDCDTHFLTANWEDLFLEAIESWDVIAAKGNEIKPIRPACLFMRKEIAYNYDWKPSDGYMGHRVTPEGTDVAIKAYHDMTRDGIRIQMMDSFSNRYGTFTGEEWGLRNIPLIYHHWHGSHLVERQVDFPTNDLLEEKSKLFGRIPWRIP